MNNHSHISQTEDLLGKACSRLKTAELRITKPRIAILEVLINRKGPASIEQIHKELAKGACDLVTVYRCLAAFEDVGIVRRSYFSNGTCLYELNLTDTHHHHIICKSCQKVETLEFCVVEGLERLIKDRGYTQVTHMLEFFGLCAECQASQAAKN